MSRGLEDSPLGVSERSLPSTNRVKKAVGSLSLTLALLGGVGAYGSSPAEAQPQTESEYAPECDYGEEPVWSRDINHDDQPGPDPREFYCKLLPSCSSIPLLPNFIIDRLEELGEITNPQYHAIAPIINKCSGDSAPTFSDYQEYLDANPWIMEVLNRNDDWIGPAVRDYVEDKPHYAYTPWAVRYAGSNVIPDETIPDPEDQPTPADSADDQTTTPEVDDDDSPVSVIPDETIQDPEDQPTPADSADDQTTTPEVDDDDSPVSVIPDETIQDPEDQPTPADSADDQTTTPEVDDDDSPVSVIPDETIQDPEDQPTPADSADDQTTSPEVDDDDSPVSVIPDETIQDPEESSETDSKRSIALVVGAATLGLIATGATTWTIRRRKNTKNR